MYAHTYMYILIIRDLPQLPQLFKNKSDLAMPAPSAPLCSFETKQ